jgi:hypothetical protein
LRAADGKGSSMLIVEHGFRDAPGVTYSIETVIGEFLGVPHRVVYNSAIRGISLAANGRRLVVPSPFFERYYAANRRSPILPIEPLATFDASMLPIDVRLVSHRIPVLFGTPTVSRRDDHIDLGIDVFGSAFFMLTRYEETVSPERDEHDRFSSRSSLARRAGFIERPLIDEYVEILWACMLLLWPMMKRRSRNFGTLVSCDVDRAYSNARLGFGHLTRQVGGDLLIRRRPTLALRNMLNYVSACSGDTACRFDPYNSRLDWMMDVGDAAGRAIAFYFICGHTSDKDGLYQVDEPILRNSLRRIHQRGHEIGVHPSYNTFRDETQLVREVAKLRAVLDAERVGQPRIGGRQHYLRWDASTTPRAYEAAGLAYDTTLSFADHAGFRCGTCHEYALFDLALDRVLNVRERPLIVMEVSVLSEAYMNLGLTDAAIDYMIDLKQTCHQFDGQFTLLWHNELFFSSRHEEFFKTLVN